MRAALRIGLVALAALGAAGAVGAGSPLAAAPNDPAGAPFVTFAHALARGDYALACAQMSDRALLAAAPQIPNVAPIRRACPAELEREAEGLDKARLASTRVVAVSVKPGRARVTVQTTFHDLAPVETGTAIVEGGAWKILEPTSDAHVGSSYLSRIPSESMLPTSRSGRPSSSTTPPTGAPSRRSATSSSSIRPPERRRRASAPSARRRAKPARSRRAAPPTVSFVKRIVAKPGDRISIPKGRVVRNGKLAREPFITSCRYAVICDFPRTFTVAAGRYYVLGDNRSASDDSRFWGPVAASAIVGRVGRVIPPDAS